MTVRPASGAVACTAEGLGRLDDPVTFTRVARANGFTPAETMALYHEKRLLLVNRLLAYPLEATWGDAEACDAELRAAISAVHTPAQWHAYAERWRTGDFATRTWPARALESWWSFEADGSEGDVPRHFYRRQSEAGETNAWHILPPYHGQPWTWLTVHQTIRSDGAYRGVAVRPRPARWTAAVGQAHLVRLMRRLGLEGLEWPWAQASDADWLWQVFCGLRRTQHRLVHLTGWQGPLLGLGQGLWLRIWPSLSAVDREGQFQGDPTGATPPTIQTHLEKWEEVLPHEWFHYLDALLAQSGRQCHTQGPVPVDTLLSEIQHAERTGTAEETPTAALPEVADRMRRLYADLATAQRTVQVPDHRWQAWPAEWVAARGGEGRDADAYLAFLDRLKTAPRPDRMLGRTAPKGSPRVSWFEDRDSLDRLLPLNLSYTTAIPPWWDRCDQAALALARADRQDVSDPEVLRDWWWSEAEERLALGFECRLPERAHAIENRPLLPDTGEIAAMEPVWQAFFAALAPVWSRLRTARARHPAG
jgi:hypothetical protein